MPTRVLIVVTNVGHYDDPTHPTGLWLSELTHAWHVFAEAGWEQTLVSPAGGGVPLEPRALKFPNIDKTAKAWLDDPAKMALLADTISADSVDSADFDAIYFTGGHAVMYDFPDNPALQRITRELYERGAVVSSVCHGYCGLLHTTLSDGSFLINGKRMTGFAWREEELAKVDELVPYNAEQVAKDRGALYEKAKLPFVPYAVVDGNLVTGQNPASAKKTAKAVVAAIWSASRRTAGTGVSTSLSRRAGSAGPMCVPANSRDGSLNKVAVTAGRAMEWCVPANSRDGSLNDSTWTKTLALLGVRPGEQPGRESQPDPSWGRGASHARASRRTAGTGVSTQPSRAHLGCLYRASRRTAGTGVSTGEPSRPTPRL